jgi:hypothetical protein
MDESESLFSQLEEEDVENGLLQNRSISNAPALQFALWKLPVALLVVFSIMTLASAIACSRDLVCRQGLPTIHNMLNGSLSGPFMVTAFNFAVGAHVATTAGVYARAVPHSYHWAWIQVGCSIGLYATIAIVLLVFPATTWRDDWANLAAIAALCFWMTSVQRALQKTDSKRVLRWSLLLLILFILSSICYIVLRMVPAAAYYAGVHGKETGILVSEVIFGASLAAFLILLMVFHTGSIKVKLHDDGDKKSK